MFGGNSTSTNGQTPGNGRPPAAQVAQIQGSLTHVLVGADPAGDGVHVFVNAAPLPAGELESLSVNIVAPTSDSDSGTLTGVIVRYQTGADGARTQRSVSLFPGTVEIIGRGRRIVVTCQQEGQFDGLWLGLGLNADGTSTELSGVQSLRVTVTPTLLDARLAWADGSGEEDLLPA